MLHKLIINTGILLQCLVFITATQAKVNLKDRDSAKERLVRTPQELQIAIQDALPGDRIVMADGIWQQINIVLKGKGEKGRPITLKAQTPGKVIISGSSSLRLSGEYLIVDGLSFKNGASSGASHLIEFRTSDGPASFSRLTNIAVSGFNKVTGSTAKDTWVSLFGKNNRVDHCLFEKKTSKSPILVVWRGDNSADNHQIDHNYFREVPPLGENGAEAIRVGTSPNSLSDSHSVIEYNIFENCNGEGELISLKSGRNIIRYNTVLQSQGSISLRHGNHNEVYGNFILGAGVKNTGGIRVMGENHLVSNNYIQGLRGSRAAISIIEGIVDSPIHGYLQVKHLNVVGNTLIDNEVNIVIGDLYNPSKKQTLRIENSTLKDNVVVGRGENAVFMRVLDEPLLMNYEGNVLHNGLPLKMKGFDLKDPQLKVSNNGIYGYAKGHEFQKNIVGQPLKKNEVGPEWLP